MREKYIFLFVQQKQQKITTNAQNSSEKNTPKQQLSTEKPNMSLFFSWHNFFNIFLFQRSYKLWHMSRKRGFLFIFGKMEKCTMNKIYVGNIIMLFKVGKLFGKVLLCAIPLSFSICSLYGRN